LKKVNQINKEKLEEALLAYKFHRIADDLERLKKTAKSHQRVDVNILERKLLSLEVILSSGLKDCLQIVKFIRKQQDKLQDKSS